MCDSVVIKSDSECLCCGSRDYRCCWEGDVEVGNWCDECYELGHNYKYMKVEVTTEGWKCYLYEDCI